MNNFDQLIEARQYSVISSLINGKIPCVTSGISSSEPIDISGTGGQAVDEINKANTFEQRMNSLLCVIVSLKV